MPPRLKLVLCPSLRYVVVFSSSNPNKIRIHNRVKALVQEEHSLTQKWAEQDLKSARETALKILPSLRLEAIQSIDGGQSADRLLRIMDTDVNNQDEHGSHFLRRFNVLDNPVEHEQTTTTTTRAAAKKSSHLFGFRRSFGLQEGGRGSSAQAAASRGRTGDIAQDQPVEEGEGTTTRMITGYEVEPAPLRARGFGYGLSEEGDSLVAFKRRYRGEGFLERRRPGLGSNSHVAANIKPDEKPRHTPDENRPTPLAQQVLRLNDGGAAGDGTSSSSESVVAVVRAVLEPPPKKKCDCGCALHSGKANQEDGEDFGLRRNLGLCEVRGVVRVEAYLPSSSATLTLRVEVPAPATTSTPGVEGSATTETHRMGNADDDAVLPLRVTVPPTTRGKDFAAAPAGADKGGTAGAGEGGSCDRQVHAFADAGHEEECRSRKQQRRMLWEARAMEKRRGAAEMLAAVQEAIQSSLLTRKNTGVTTQQHQSLGSDTCAHDSSPKLNNAFNMLLIRANVIVPVKRLNLTSGSWREAIEELVGCPPGQELRAVRALAN